MKNVLAIALAFVASFASAEALRGVVEFQGTQTLADPTTFADVEVDVYNVVVTNPNAFNVYTFSLDLPSEGAPYFASTQSVGTGFPQLGPFTVADSFFLRNAAAPGGAVNPIGIADSASGLSGTVTVLAADPTNGNAPVDDAARIAVGAGGTSALAVLAVPAGSSAITGASFSGTAVIDGSLEQIVFIPEPSTALLAGLALVGFVARRK